MLLWLASLSVGMPLGGASYGSSFWHAHELLFGYASAALAGFLLTAIPNWTGRLPVSGRPLLALVFVWTAGRIAMLLPDVLGPAVAVVDSAFLVTLAAVVAREIVSGKNWRNLKMLGVVTALAALNIWMHAAVALGTGTQVPVRLTVATYVVLVAIVGGRIVPSFTRNWLARRGSPVLPASFGRLDAMAIAALAISLAVWAFLPLAPGGSVLAVIAAVLNVWRLARWCGHRTVTEPLLLVLHAGYGFIPVGLVAIAVSTFDALNAMSSLHILTVGVIGLMTLGVMTRASLGHTGGELKASPTTSLSYLLVVAAALTRPLADLFPSFYQPFLTISGGAWVLSFVLFSVEYAPRLLTRGVRRA